MLETSLNFYGIKVNVIGSKKEMSNTKHDYSFFVQKESHTNYDIRFTLHNSIDYNIIPNLKASAYHQDYIIYDDKNIRYLDFHGNCLCVHNKEKKTFDIYATDEILRYETYHLFLMTIIGDLLDKKGLNRIHCLSISKNNKSCLIIMPMGAGKTTTALKIIQKSKDISILSDDIAITDGKKIYPFPIRIGIRAGQKNPFNKKYTRFFERTKEHDKHLVDITKIINIPRTPIKPHLLMIGKRAHNNTCQIKRSSFIKISPYLFKSAVLGLELPQALAILFEKFPKIIMKTPIFLKRWKNVFSIARKSKIYTIDLGYDIDNNYKTLEKFLKKQMRN